MIVARGICESRPASDRTRGGGRCPRRISRSTAINALDTEIKWIDVTGLNAAANTAYTINITSQINLTSALEAINLDSGSSLIIEGTNGSGAAKTQTIDGEGDQRGFFVYSGTVTLENLNIENAHAVGGAGARASAAFPL